MAGRDEEIRQVVADLDVLLERLNANVSALAGILAPQRGGEASDG